MSKFLDRLEQINLGTSTSMGFGASRAKRPPGMALVGMVSKNHSGGIQSLAALAPDAVLISGIEDPSVIRDLSQMLGGNIPWGARLSSLDEQDSRSLEEGGCDLMAFPLQGTAIAAAASEQMASILYIEMDIDVDHLPAIGALPVDVLLLPMTDVSAAWTLSDLAAITRISLRVNQDILLEISHIPGPKELEALRKVGVNGLVLDVATVKTAELAELKTTMQDMPRQRSDRRDRTTAILPSSAFPGGFETEREESEPEEDL